MTGDFFKAGPMRILMALTFLMIIIALASYARLNFAQTEFINPNPPTISVTGEGEVLAVPDVGQFSFSVRAEGADAATAQEASGTKINAILAYLKEQGIEDKDIKTQNYSLNPKWKYEDKVCAFNSYCPPGEQVQDGFEVSQTVSVKVRKTDQAGVIIAGVGERGATDISNLNFTIDDVDALQAEARDAAIKDAEAKAELLAKQLGVRVVRLLGFSEGGFNQPYIMDSKAMAFEESADFSGPDLPVGEQSTRVQVNLVYEVR